MHQPKTQSSVKTIHQPDCLKGAKISGVSGVTIRVEVLLPHHK